MIGDKVLIRRDNGEMAEAKSPAIVSASRSTDIPAFYSDWFLHRLKVGYSAWTNPFNGTKSYVSYQNTRLIVFWSKNPKHLLDKDGLLDYLQTKEINSYVQYTLNDYENEQLERGVPPLADRIDTFKSLVDRLGFGKVIWRFDPLILTDTVNINSLLDKIKRIGDYLKGYTEKLVFSFADIDTYRKVKANLEKNNIIYRNFSEHEMLQFAAGLQQLNREWNFTLASCGEKIDLDQFGIVHNKCVDDNLIIKHFSADRKLMDFLGVDIKEPNLFGEEKKKNIKDKGQRPFCGCIVSKDIGEYNTCAHLCDYCYANTSKESAMSNFRRHLDNPHSETITGK
ncbi:MAG: DUF1848 domain-containing protein [Bacteroidales bacterium]|nr:DUF1848 domain-containing protein [Bacteroidales bacterium]